MPRGAFTLAEVAVAAAMLGLLMVLIGQFLVRFDVAEAGATKKQQALRLLENQLERCAAVVHRDGRLPALALTPEEEQTFKQGQLSIEQGAHDDLGFAPVTLRFSWVDVSGERTQPLALTAWLPLTSDSASDQEGTE